MNNEQETERMARLICPFEYNLSEFKNCVECQEDKLIYSKGFVCPYISSSRKLLANGIGDKKQAVKEAFEKLVFELYCNNMNKQEMYIDDEWISVDDYVQKVANKIVTELYGGAE